MDYLNTLPLIWGFKHSEINDQMDVRFEYPAKVAKMMLEDEVDIGLLPVAVMPLLPEAHIVSSWCIGANKHVSSVCIFSDVPMEEITHLYLDYQSRTSVNLARVLLKEFWKKDPILIKAEEGFINNIKGSTAAVVIGDRALKLIKKTKYVYDLAEAWYQHTGLPFVFAAWVANKKIPQSFVKVFDEAVGAGMKHIDEIVKGVDFPEYDLKKYYEVDIDYVLDDRKREAIKLFHEKLKTLAPL